MSIKNLFRRILPKKVKTELIKLFSLKQTYEKRNKIKKVRCIHKEIEKKLNP